MRVNLYAEEMTDQIEIISKKIDGHTFTGLRLYLYMPVTLGTEGYRLPPATGTAVVEHVDGVAHAKGPFIHRPGDDDSSAVTFWGKRDLREVLKKMLAKLDEHYDAHLDEHFPGR